MFFSNIYSTTVDQDEKQASGSLHVWLLTLKKYHEMAWQMVQLNTPKLVFGLDLSQQSCPNCGATTMLRNQYNCANQRCGMCGQILKWYKNE